MLAPGNYTFYFSADTTKYFPQTIDNVVVENFQTTLLNVELIPKPVTNVAQTDFRAFNSYLLEQNFPNPFNPSTKIRWQSPVASWQTLKVFDVLGNEVAKLVDEHKLAGSYEVQFNASALPSGVYFYQLKAVDPSTGSGQVYVETKKMLLIK